MNRQDYDAEIAARKQAAGQLGFIFGCVAAVCAAIIHFYRAVRPMSVGVAITAILMAALNIPFGVALGLVLERVSRPKRDEGGSA